MRRMVDIRCASCGLVEQDRYVDLDTLDPHENCGGRFERVRLNGVAAPVRQDSIPGGVWIKNGLCHEDGSPRRFDSHSEIAKEAKRQGLTHGATRHVPSRGSDKNPHTTRWV